MTEAEATRLSHPTPIAILASVMDAVAAADRATGYQVPQEVYTAIREGVKRANEEHHREHA